MLEYCHLASLTCITRFIFMKYIFLIMNPKIMKAIEFANVRKSGAFDLGNTDMTDDEFH